MLLMYNAYQVELVRQKNVNKLKNVEACLHL